MSDLIITMRDMRAVKYCAAGVRRFFHAHKLPWREFLQNGIHESELLKTEDPMAIKVVRAAHERRQ